MIHLLKFARKQPENIKKDFCLESMWDGLVEGKIKTLKNNRDKIQAHVPVSRGSKRIRTYINTHTHTSIGNKVLFFKNN